MVRPTPNPSPRSNPAPTLPPLVSAEQSGNGGGGSTASEMKIGGSPPRVTDAKPGMFENVRELAGFFAVVLALVMLLIGAGVIAFTLV